MIDATDTRASGHDGGRYPTSPYSSALKDATRRSALVFLLTFPLIGLRLEGFSFSAHLSLPIVLAAAVFAFSVVIDGIVGSRLGSTLIQRIRRSDQHHAGVGDERLSPRQKLAITAIVTAAACVPFFAGSYVLTTLILAMIYIVLGLGLSIVVGLAGLLDLGYVAFYAIGAYTMAIGGHYLGLGLWEAIPIAAALAGLAGGILAFPVLRVHGDYLAIVTLGFGEIIRLILNNWVELTGGPNGMEVPEVTFFGYPFARKSTSGETFHELFDLSFSSSHKFAFLYLVLLSVVCLTVFVVRRLRAMPVGRAWEALREDQVACGSLGLNHITIKLSAFIIGASFGGIGGVFFASYQGFVNPTSFVFVESALVLAIVVLGGMGSTVGVICAALFLTILPEVLRNAAEYRLLALGLIMVLLMIWRPRGLVRVNRRAYQDPGLTDA